ncbi:TonB-linked outer membrane protein, SusC/RagA family [Chryseobacterium taklimakanense]|uniref:TonB-linked outer membrane protein, SusC/RagA family n=1 Tax=Chryseobacterium taklimakanense TaxID=536441 RepID=A0A239X9B7_9FLAO|nr:hypothetical protein [Chryseobacterium taklimakanense]SNV42773.1 TonB-linked outer membrane protein, SusC/RagA family [Chryseobacterium taklimakanense]
MNKFLLFIFILAFGFVGAQQYVIGHVTTDAGTKVPGVLVFNVHTEETARTDSDGNFIIRARSSDELRFIKNNFERVSVKVQPDHFTRPLNIAIQLRAQLIEEVEIAFKPTGNLRKDVRALDRPKKVEELNNNLAKWVQSGPAMAYPSNKMPSSLVLGPDMKSGQLSLFSSGGGGLLGAAIKSISKAVQPAKTTADYAETQAFYKRVKENIDLGYFYKHGIDEYQFEMLLAFVDGKYQLAKNFRSNFNKTAIEFYLKKELKDFMNRNKMKSVEEPA